MKQTFFIVIAVVAVGAGGLVWWRPTASAGSEPGPGDAPGEAQVYVVERRDLRVTITATGQLKAKESVPVHSPHENSWATIAFIAEEGTEVEEGAEILRFDPEEMSKRVDDLEQELIEHESSVKSATADLEIKQSTTQMAVDEAELKLETARKELTKALEGTLVLQEQDLNVKVRQAKYQEELATRQLADMEDLANEGFYTAEQIEEQRAALDRHTSAHESAKLEMQIFTEFTRPMEIRAKENAVSSAEQQLANARKQRESSLASAEANLNRSQRRLKRTQEQLEEAKKDLAKMVVTSPGSGIIIYGDPDQPWYDAKPKVGDKVWPHQTVLTLPVLTVMQVRLEVHESDIGRIAVGQKAHITLEVDPDLQLTGSLTKIGSLATGRGNDPNVREFDCEVTIDQERLGHKPGISAKVELLIEELEDVLAVPVQAVHLKEGAHLVYVDQDGKPVPREVTLGASTTTLVQVLEGLAEGDRVLLVDPELE